MKQSIKNTIMIGMATVLIGTSAVTFAYAGDRHIDMPQVQQSQQFEQRGDFDNQNSNPIEGFGKQDGQSGNRQNAQPPAQQNDNQQNAQPPAQQGDNQQNDNQQKAQPPAQQNDNQQNAQSPAQQGDSQQNNNTDNKSDSTAPSDKNTSTTDTDLNVIETAKGMRQTDMNRGHSNIIQVLCYLFGGLQIAIIAVILLYLAFSEFNKLSFNQTLFKFKK